MRAVRPAGELGLEGLTPISLPDPGGLEPGGIRVRR